MVIVWPSAPSVTPGPTVKPSAAPSGALSNVMRSVGPAEALNRTCSALEVTAAAAVEAPSS